MILRSPSGLKRVSWIFTPASRFPSDKDIRALPNCLSLRALPGPSGEKRLLSHVPRLQALRPELLLPPGNSERTGAGSTEAMRKTLTDPEFQRSFKNSQGTMRHL